MSHPHLSDDQLLEICLSLEVPSSNREHLTTCVTCESRRTSLAGMMDDAGAVMARQADEAFPAERLARQRARILQRAEQDGRPGRVIHFPASHTHEAPRHVRPARWAGVAAAVAAAFLVGLLAEHLAHDLPGSRQVTVARTQPAAPVTPILAAASDDELLGQVELAATGVGPAVLRPLDALTPRAWDIR